MDNNFTNQLIYEKKQSLSSILCNDIINLYEQNSDKHRDGTVIAGMFKHIKDTTDMLIPKNYDIEENVVWQKISETLHAELQENIKIYTDNLTFDKLIKDNCKLLGSSELHVDNFMIQKYAKLSGKYTYHDDFIAEPINNRYRVITYIWYLNTVEEGGHTEFFGSHLIKPEQGKLLLFPSSWTFPHCGKVPISDDKYIITGWFHVINPATQYNVKYYDEVKCDEVN
jgi:Rps23 Pro-64 3,4-dihydroxylase Tpa1-like proline 4-hydroxylase